MLDNSLIDLLFESLPDLEDFKKANEFNIDNYVDGEHFLYDGIEFVRLGEEQGGVLAITEKIWKIEPIEKQRDKYNITWQNSSLRKELKNSEFGNLNCHDVMPMLDADCLNDRVSLLNYDQWKKYRNLLPKYSDWIWLRFPHFYYPHYFCIVTSGGFTNYYSANDSNGCAPIVLFRKRSEKNDFKY